MAHSIRNAATSVMEWFESTGTGTAADPFVPNANFADEFGAPLGRAENPMFVHRSPRLADTVGHKTYNMFGENDSVTAVTTGDDIWLGTTTTLPFPNQIVGEQMVIKSDDTTDIGNPEGTMTSATHATNLDDTTALWQTRAVAAGDVILNVTDGSSTTVASVTSEIALVTKVIFIPCVLLTWSRLTSGKIC